MEFVQVALVAGITLAIGGSAGLFHAALLPSTQANETGIYAENRSNILRNATLEPTPTPSLAAFSNENQGQTIGLLLAAMLLQAESRKVTP